MTRVDKSGRREIRLTTGDSHIPNEPKPRSGTIWKSTRRSRRQSCRIHLSSMLPLEMNLIILGYGKDNPGLGHDLHEHLQNIR